MHDGDSAQPDAPATTTPPECSAAAPELDELEELDDREERPPTGQDEQGHMPPCRPPIKASTSIELALPKNLLGERFAELAAARAAQIAAH